jgi:hypothetical protein
MVIGKAKNIGRNYYQNLNIHSLLIVFVALSLIILMQSEHFAFLSLYLLAFFLSHILKDSTVERERTHVVIDTTVTTGINHQIYVNTISETAKNDDLLVKVMLGDDGDNDLLLYSQ